MCRATSTPTRSRPTPGGDGASRSRPRSSATSRTTCKFGVHGAVRLGVEARAASWNGQTWEVTTDGGSHRGELLVAACGQLSRPAIPALPGLERFRGPAFRSSQWRRELDLSGTRVGVIGIGASAIQFVPAIQPQVASLLVAQRTPPWILPKPDRSYTRRETARFESLPLAQRLGRFGFWAVLEAGIPGFVGHEAVLAPLAALSRAHLRRQVKDPSLHARVMPHGRVGCKRIHELELPGEQAGIETLRALDVWRGEIGPAEGSRRKARALADGATVSELDIELSFRSWAPRSVRRFRPRAARAPRNSGASLRSANCTSHVEAGARRPRCCCSGALSVAAAGGGRRSAATATSRRRPPTAQRSCRDGVGRHRAPDTRATRGLLERGTARQCGCRVRSTGQQRDRPHRSGTLLRHAGREPRWRTPPELGEAERGLQSDLQFRAS
jgi:hypothetical protein